MYIVGGKPNYQCAGIGGCIQCAMVKANPSLSLRTGSLDLPKAELGAIAKRFSPAIWADPVVVPYAARVSVWGRWFIALVSAFEIAYRPDLWYPDGWG